MDEDNTLNFCTECGANIRSYDEFCPSCGCNLKQKSQRQNVTNRGDNKLNLVAIMGGIWAFFALMVGIVCIVSLDAMMDAMIEVYGNTFDVEFLETIILIVGYCLLASGILSVISVVLCATRKYYTIALITCIVGSLLALLCTIIIGILGFIAAYWIYKSKDWFVKNNNYL